jgi:hypothetical protein
MHVLLSDDKALLGFVAFDLPLTTISSRLAALLPHNGR